MGAVMIFAPLSLMAVAYRRVSGSWGTELKPVGWARSPSPALGQLGEGHDILNGEAVVFFTGYLHFHQKILSIGFLDGLCHHDGELGSVLHGAAEFIGTGIGQRRKEIVE